MDRNHQANNRQWEFSLLNFIFLLVLFLNAIIIADLFLSILRSPLTLIVIQVVLMLTVLAFLVSNSARHPEIRGQGWYFILAGFGLLFAESLFECLALFPPTRNPIVRFNQLGFEFIENVFFRIFGFFCLAYGFFLWIPSILEARRRIVETAVMLENMVAERTRSLQESNEQLLRSKAKLEEAARLKNEFLAAFSHELKTPLNSILGFCRLLREERQGPLTPKQLKSIEIIFSNSHSLLERINLILDYAKLEFEKIAAEVQPVNVPELLSEVTYLFEPALKEKGIELVLDSGDTAIEVDTDRKIISQLLLAVIDNAVKFTDKGRITVSFGLDQDGTKWWFAVRDTGPGIPAADIPFIFDPFRQGDGSFSRKYGGTGLGLTIARKLTRLLGGLINVESAPGEGTAFTFSFPLNTRDTAGPAVREAGEIIKN